jgi:hypothetical protein
VQKSEDILTIGCGHVIETLSSRVFKSSHTNLSVSLWNMLSGRRRRSVSDAAQWKGMALVFMSHLDFIPHFRVSGSGKKWRMTIMTATCLKARKTQNLSNSAAVND